MLSKLNKLGDEKERFKWKSKEEGGGKASEGVDSPKSAQPKK